MTERIQIAPQQLALLAGVSLFTDAFIQPFGRQSGTASAQMGILATACQLLIWYGVFLLLRRKAGSRQNQFVCGLLLPALLLAAGLELIQGERFYSYVMDKNLAVAAFVGIVLVTAYYGVHSGMNALSRTASAILAVSAVSVVFLVVSVVPQLRFTNLQPAAPGLADLLAALRRQFYLPPELFFWAFLLENTAAPPKKVHAPAVFLGLLSVSSLFFLIGEMTLGPAYQTQEQPLFTIARLGGISVFRRLDALHASVWLLLFLVKITLYFAMAVHLAQQLCPALGGRGPFFLVSAGVLLVFLSAWSQQENTAFWLLQAALAILLLTILLIPKKEPAK